MKLLKTCKFVNICLWGLTYIHQGSCLWILWMKQNYWLIAKQGYFSSNYIQWMLHWCQFHNLFIYFSETTFYKRWRLKIKKSIQLRRYVSLIAKILFQNKSNKITIFKLSDMYICDFWLILIIAAKYAAEGCRQIRKGRGCCAEQIRSCRPLPWKWMEQAQLWSRIGSSTLL